jgi:transcriptional regulator with XRE-family HTH domain
MVSIAKLIRDARAAAGLSQEDLAQKLEVSRQTVQQWEKGTSGPKRKRAVLVARILKIDIAKLDPFAQPAKIIDSVTLESHKIPLLRIEKTILKAGDARDLPNSLRAYADDMLAVSESFKECFAVSIGDNSMKPLYQEGDICIVDPKISPIDNDVVVASFPGDALILRTYVSRGIDSTGFEAFDLTTPNADLTTYTVNSKNPADILGVVVEFRRTTRKR